MIARCCPLQALQSIIMGGGASVLSSEDFVTMSQNLKEEYEVLISSGYTDDEIREKLMEKYNELFIPIETNLAEAVVSVGDVDAQTESTVATGMQFFNAAIPQNLHPHELLCTIYKFKKWEKMYLKILRRFFRRTKV